MDAGYADRLCVDYWYEFDLDQYVSIIRPDGRRFFPGERCTFLTSKWQCELHDTAFKPLECRAALLCADTTQGPGRERIARDWNNDAGRAAVARLESLTEVKESVA